MIGINHLTLPLKFGVLRRNIHEDIQQAILAARFLSKNSLKKRTTCLFPTLPSTFFTYFGYHLKGIDELITYMPSKVKGTVIFVEEMSGTSALSIFAPTFCSKIRPKKAKYIHFHLSESIPMWSFMVGETY